MGKTTYNLGICVQAHEDRRRRLDRVVSMGTRLPDDPELLRRYKAVDFMDNLDLRHMAILMTCVFPDIGKDEKGPTHLNGESTLGVAFTPTRAHYRAGLEELAHEHKVLRDSPITYVGAEVCDLLNVAVSKMDADILHETDLTAPEGFLYLAKPFLLPDFHPETGEYDDRLFSAVRAIAWRTRDIGIAQDASGTKRAKGIVFTLLADNGIIRDIVMTGLRQVWEDDGHAEPFDERVPPGPDHSLYPTDQQAWAFQVPWTVNPDLTAKKMMNRDDLTLTPEPVAYVRKWFLAFMRFCWQEIIVPRKPSNQDLSRQQRRALERQSKVSDPINVVYLRRVHEKTDDNTTEGQSLAYRVLVRGHWRNQYYPSLGPVSDPMSHRRIWIDPHVKGPDHAPFRDSVKVTAVVR